MLHKLMNNETRFKLTTTFIVLIGYETLSLRLRMICEEGKKLPVS
jgi:hypothetical protein